MRRKITVKLNNSALHLQNYTEKMWKKTKCSVVRAAEEILGHQINITHKSL